MSTENIQRTLLASKVQACLNTNTAYTPDAHSTLNEKFNVQNGIVPPVGVTPTLQYWGVGIGGSTYTQGINNVPIPTPQGHKATDASLFLPVPFVLRPLTNDLTTQQQANYRMRVPMTIGGVAYAAYYLKLIPYNGATPSLNLVTVANGVSTTTPYTYTTANLNPTPQPLSNTGVNTTSGNYVEASIPVTLSMAEFDVQEFQNACTLLYGSADYAVVSEICIVSGVDKATTSFGAGSTTINFTEVLCAQICAFINTLSALNFMTDGTQWNIDIGATEPLFMLQST